MKTETFTLRSRFPVPADELFAWHARPDAFERLTPAWDHVQIVEQSGGIAEGARTIIRVPWLGPFKRQWESVHTDYQEGRQFVDSQIKGPFAKFVHRHLFEPDGPNASFLEDRIEYALPFGFLGRLFGGRKVRRILERTFAYRHAILQHDLNLHASRLGDKPWKILVTGASGLVGSALVPFLTTGGHSVTLLARRASEEGTLSPSPSSVQSISWDAIQKGENLDALEGFDAVIHLAGESIAQGRWTAAKMERIRKSRVDNTRLLSEALANLKSPPRVLLSASAVGYYGDRGDEVLDEASAAGVGFLADVCRDWEAATQPAQRSGIRVANLRFGVILSAGGGALAKMLTPFRLGLGGKIGGGRQYMSWIALDDLLGVMHNTMFHDEAAGPINVAAPQSITNRDFTKTLGRVLRRPTFFAMPRFAARLAFGKMANELLLASQRVVPKKLQETGFQFAYPDLEGALRHVLGKPLKS